MKIVLYANYINHHMVWVADELYRLTNGMFKYVCIQYMPDKFKKTGYPDFFDRPYIVKAFEQEGFYEAERMAVEFDVAIFHGSEDVQHFRDLRLKKDKLSFESGERWLKKGWKNMLSPRFIKSQWRYHLKYKKCKNYYSLNASAYLLNDYTLFHSFKNRCFKWGYFTNVEDLDITQKTFTGTQMMWVNRFIDWKHPEMPIIMAKRLKDSGHDFTLDMYGNGELYGAMVDLAKKLDVCDRVIFNGNLPNEGIRSEMQNHDIVLTTSDQNEGWGATVNEAMSNGCVLIGSDKVGSVPYLVKNEENGLIFKSQNINSLYNSVVSVLGKPDRCMELAMKAYITMRDIWSPSNAANSLIRLCDDLLNHNDLSVVEGPCSPDF